MEIVKRQMEFNISVLVLSVIVVLFAKTVQSNGTVTFEAFLGSDLVLLLFTSLATTVGWRYAEHISRFSLHDLFSVFFLIVLSIEYGIAIDHSEMMMLAIEISCIVFVAVYIMENIIIYKFFFNKKVRQRQYIDYGYSRSDKEVFY